MANCRNCVHCNIKTDEDYTKRLICTGTKRGRTLSWIMCGPVDSINLLSYFAEWAESHETPKWCPKQKI